MSSYDKTKKPKPSTAQPQPQPQKADNQPPKKQAPTTEVKPARNLQVVEAPAANDSNSDNDSCSDNDNDSESGSLSLDESGATPKRNERLEADAGSDSGVSEAFSESDFPPPPQPPLPPSRWIPSYLMPPPNVLPDPRMQFGLQMAPQMMQAHPPGHFGHHMQMSGIIPVQMPGYPPMPVPHQPLYYYSPYAIPQSYINPDLVVGDPRYDYNYDAMNGSDFSQDEDDNDEDSLEVKRPAKKSKDSPSKQRA